MQNKKIVVLISGSGSNLQAFIEAQKEPEFGGEIVAVISNRADAFGLQRAMKSGIPAITKLHTDYASREDFEHVLVDEINRHKPNLVLLAGFMRILTPAFVEHFQGRLLNIHPSLLPKYTGLHTHRRAFENKDEYHGSSVHFVTEELDGGPVIAQTRTKITPNDTEETLSSRILALEHKLYPAVVKMLIKGQIELKQGEIYFENRKLEKPIPL